MNFFGPVAVNSGTVMDRVAIPEIAIDIQQIQKWLAAHVK
jgi:hypothetical protein